MPTRREFLSAIAAGAVLARFPWLRAPVIEDSILINAAGDYSLGWYITQELLDDDLYGVQEERLAKAMMDEWDISTTKGDAPLYRVRARSVGEPSIEAVSVWRVRDH